MDLSETSGAEKKGGHAIYIVPNLSHVCTMSEDCRLEESGGRTLMQVATAFPSAMKGMCAGLTINKT